MKFLVFQHVPHEHPGLISDFAKKNNITLDRIEFWKDYEIPSLSKYNALIIMGGPMGVYENKFLYPSKEDELRVIKKALEKIPVLGFCLGSQLLAHALGAKVYPNIINDRHKKEIGYYDVSLTVDGQKDPLFNGFENQFKVLQWHGDAFDLPQSSKLLATSPLCHNQVFRYKSAYGLLFHFEFTPVMIINQISIDKDWIHRDFEVDEQKLIMEANEYSVEMKKQSNLLLTNFLSSF